MGKEVAPGICASNLDSYKGFLGEWSLPEKAGTDHKHCFSYEKASPETNNTPESCNNIRTESVLLTINIC